MILFPKQYSTSPSYELIFSLLCNNLSGNINLIGHIEDIKTDIISKISKINLFIGIKSQFSDMFSFPSCDTRNSSHNFFNILLDVAEIPTDGGVPHDLSDIFHGVGTVIRGNGTRFSNGVNVSHVSDWRRGDTMNGTDVFVDFFIPKILKRGVSFSARGG